MHWLAIAAGGALGALARYALTGWVQSGRWAPASFPLGTFVVNVAGCFLIGLLASLFYERSMVAPPVRSFVLVGILGSFTTFSTFGFETVILLEEGRLGLAAGNVAGSVLLGVAGVLLGAAVGRML